MVPQLGWQGKGFGAAVALVSLSLLLLLHVVHGYLVTLQLDPTLRLKFTEITRKSESKAMHGFLVQVQI